MTITLPFWIFIIFSYYLELRTQLLHSKCQTQLLINVVLLHILFLLVNLSTIHPCCQNHEPVQVLEQKPEHPSPSWFPRWLFDSTNVHWALNQITGIMCSYLKIIHAPHKNNPWFNYFSCLNMAALNIFLYRCYSEQDPPSNHHYRTYFRHKFGSPFMLLTEIATT